MQERKEGGELVLTAKFDGSPPPTAIWLLEGEEIKADGERVIITEEESEDGKGTDTAHCSKGGAKVKINDFKF